MADNDADDGGADDVTDDDTGGSADGDHGAGEPTDDEQSDEPAGVPEDVTLDDLREEIQSIDREIVERIAQRTYVADSIAQVKREQGLPTTDESQEDRVMERAGENAERFDVDANLVKAIFRLLIELNKVHQRENR